MAWGREAVGRERSAVVEEGMLEREASADVLRLEVAEEERWCRRCEGRG